MRTNSILIIITACLLAGVIGAAESPSPAQTVLLTLVDGAAKSLPTDYETHDLELELVRRGGAFEPKVWGYAEDLGYGDHEGQVTASKDGRLEIEMILNQPHPTPVSERRFGMARYAITLTEKDGQYTGTFTGTVTIESPAPMAGQSNVREVSGKLTGKTWPCWTEPRPGFKPLAPKEHPRLIFRKHDLPMLRERMKTPEGQAIMARMKERLNRKSMKPSYDAASWAVAYQLTGEAVMADKAREALAPVLGQPLNNKWSYMHGAMGIALTLDNCYDAWDEKFRQQALDKLLEWQRFLNGSPILAKDPWVNDLRASGIAMAAICLLGEQNADGKPIPELDDVVQSGMRYMRRHFQHNGTSNSGFPLELKCMKLWTWDSGPGHAIHAYRSAFGGDPMTGLLGGWTMPGDWMREEPIDDIAARERFGLSKSARTGEQSGFYTTAWVTVPEAMKAGTRWLFDRCFGLEGTKTFEIHWPYQAGYVLMNYPFDIPARPPSESLPWMAPDPSGGHWVFRKPWQGKDDSMVRLNPRNDLRRKAGHYCGDPNWDLTLCSQGRKWMGLGNGQYIRYADLPGCALPLMGEDLHRKCMSSRLLPGEGGNFPLDALNGALNRQYSSRLIEYQADDRGKASLSFDMSPIYMRYQFKGETLQPGQQLRGGLVDLGIRGKRDLAFDLSGDCGAPVLMAIMDRFQNAKDLVWRLILDTNAGPAQVVGNTVTVGDPAAENMRVTFVSPKSPTLTGEITAQGGEEYFVIITVQKGKAPEMKIEGEGLSAKVTVGGQTIHLDGERLVIGNLNKPKQP